MTLDDPHIERFCRQIILPEIGAGGQERLCRGRVLLAGLSAPGATALAYVAAAGVRHFGIAGPAANVSPADAAAPFGVGMEEVGEPWGSAAAALLHRANPEAAIETLAEEVARAPGAWDVLLASGTNRSRMCRANLLSLEARVPLVAVAAGVRGGCLVGLAGHDPEAPCAACVPDLEARLDLGPERGAATAIAAGIIGTLAAVEILKQLLAVGLPPAGRLVRYDPGDPELHGIALRKDPSCRVCGPGGRLRASAAARVA
jgi:adenylyltransferase/sulfurtransferase